MTVPPFAERLAAATRYLATHQADHLPGWWVDQHQAATAEARGNLHAAANELHHLDPATWRRSVAETDPTVESTALVLAALAGCQLCPHIGSAPTVAAANLGRRTVTCPRCTEISPMGDVDDRGSCDVCDRPLAGDVYHPFVLTMGGITIAGNAGADCCARTLFADRSGINPA